VTELTTDLLLRAYSHGYFPMADPAVGDAVHWYAPNPRALLPLDERFHLSKNLRKVLRRRTFRVTSDVAFERVIRACARTGDHKSTSWISEEIVLAYVDLHEHGYAHSVECWSGSRLAGGLYGVALGGAFFGESMFHDETDASKVSLAHLVERLRAGGYTLLDVQFMTDHLARFGAFTVPRRRYERLLLEALELPASWTAIDGSTGEPD
jgi:leucyl/phenylalanyl-tRNA---protein transferase